ncbi:hypothetical protein RDI58_018246 [Solanum bulbocastanum]|uniref:Uncharacterized protein n=1 Tax=Solanum bulbocastanum TaxID=147425 RepID=A0AAN8TJ77_SOLBU
MISLCRLHGSCKVHLLISKELILQTSGSCEGSFYMLAEHTRMELRKKLTAIAKLVGDHDDDFIIPLSMNLKKGPFFLEQIDEQDNNNLNSKSQVPNTCASHCSCVI